MRSEFGDVECNVDDRRTAGKGYYIDLCFHIHILASEGKPIEVVDGGPVDWARKLGGDAKERLVVSGIGSERLCSLAP